MKRIPIPKKSNSESAVLKDHIQETVRAIVIARDGTCILRSTRRCSDPVLQADHLITRSNSATYADTRLIVCACRSCHGWKHWHKEEYDALVRELLPADRVALWDRALKDSWRPKYGSSTNWKLELAALKQELKSYK